MWPGSFGKPLYPFLAAEGSAFDGLPEEGEEERALQLAHWRAIKNCGDLYYAFASMEEVASRVRELRFPARSAGAPRRVVNLPYDSLGPLFKGRDAELAELRQRFMTSGGRAVRLTTARRGAEHPMVATVLGNLAEVLVDLGRPSEAEPLYRQALAIDERSPESENPALATSLNDLAEPLRTTNRMSEAEPLYRRALEIDERTLGREHPNVARDLNNLALLLQMTDRVREGELLSQRAVQVFAEFARRTGHEHPSFGAAITNYARLLAAMDLSEDEILIRPVGVIRLGLDAALGGKKA